MLWLANVGYSHNIQGLCKEQPPAPRDFVAVWRLKDGGNGAATVGRRVHAGILPSGAYGE